MPDNIIIKILDVKINVLAKADVLERIRNLLLSESKEQYQLVTTNPEFIMAAQKDEEFKNIINNSWLSVADGYGLRLAAKYLDLVSHMSSSPRIAVWGKLQRGSRGILCDLFSGLKIACRGILKKDEKLDIIKETITGTDLIPEICRLVSVIPISYFVIPAKAGIQAEEVLFNHGNKFSGSRIKFGMTIRKIFLLGGFGDTPKLTAEALLKSPPFQGGVGVVNNFKNILISYATFEESDIIEKINSFQPTVLFVALNHPRAQKWIDENLSKMPSVKLAIGVGGAFDYLSGKIKRAPESWRSNGLEWMYRLFYQPKRWKRIWTACVKFPWLVFRNTI